MNEVEDERVMNGDLERLGTNIPSEGQTWRVVKVVARVGYAWCPTPARFLPLLTFEAQSRVPSVQKKR